MQATATIPKRHEGKSALVIGAGTVGGGWGIGKASAAVLARGGAKVCCFDLDAALAEEAAATLQSEGHVAIGIAGDAARTTDLKRAVDETVAAFGGIDILVCNVGIVVPGGVVELAEEDWDRVFAVNLKSCYLAMKHAVPAMLKRGGGAIVNVSSISSIRFLGRNYVSYYASKAALNHMTSVTAVEYARRQIRVNAVAPGLMDTPMARQSAIKNWGARPEDMGSLWAKRAERIPMGWMGDAFDIAHAVSFLASSEARFITGQTLVVDGGMTLCVG
jgi:NAD(P)-dependent dehydrogenase (short-subunit alcohol dehydrogenase family)